MYNIAAGHAIASARRKAGNFPAVRAGGLGGKSGERTVRGRGRRAYELTGSQKWSRKVFMPRTRGPSSNGRWPGWSMRRS